MRPASTAPLALAVIPLLAGCQATARPAEVNVVGGHAEARHVEWTGYGLTVDPLPAQPLPPPEDKQPRQLTPWILILDPLPQDPKAIPAAVGSPQPAATPPVPATPPQESPK